jgi:hypothetical protein
MRTSDDKILDLLNPSKEEKNEYGLDSMSSVSTVSVAIAKGLNAYDTYQIVVEAQGKSELHASIILTTDKSLNILPDGVPLRLYVNSDFEEETRYFTYLPPSDTFQLALNLKSYTFGLDYSISLK